MGPTADESTEHQQRALTTFLRLLVALGSAIRRNVRRLRTWNRRGGAGPSGLAALVEAHALQSAGDATVTVALAGSLFFSVPTHEARSRVALYLLITMAPFAVVAPVLGPLLDRFRRGRRTALAVTMLARAVLALVIGRSLSSHTNVTQALTLYPAALGVLVASKAYGIARSAAVPRLVPPGMTLVQANSRLTLAGVVAPAAAGSVAAAVATLLGHRTELLLGAAVYVLAAVVAIRLPAAADGGPAPPAASAVAALTSAPADSTGGVVGLTRARDDVRHALRSAAALRWLSGFMLLFGAFVVRVHPLGGLPANVCLGALGLGIAAGNVLGTTLGPRTASVTSGRLSATLLGATATACAVTALYFGLLAVFALAVIGSAAAAVSKLALDGTIQARIDESVRTSMFARSETTLQLAWVVGGGGGILLPTRAGIGFTVAAIVLGAALAVALGFRPHLPTGSTGPVEAPGG
jgi:MFS family permease